MNISNSFSPPKTRCASRDPFARRPLSRVAAPLSRVAPTLSRVAPPLSRVATPLSHVAMPLSHVAIFEDGVRGIGKKKFAPAARHMGKKKFAPAARHIIKFHACGVLSLCIFWGHQIFFCRNFK